MWAGDMLSEYANLFSRDQLPDSVNTLISISASVDSATRAVHEYSACMGAPSNIARVDCGHVHKRPAVGDRANLDLSLTSSHLWRETSIEDLDQRRLGPWQLRFLHYKRPRIASLRSRNDTLLAILVRRYRPPTE